MTEKRIACANKRERERERGSVFQDYLSTIDTHGENCRGVCCRSRSSVDLLAVATAGGTHGIRRVRRVQYNAI